MVVVSEWRLLHQQMNLLSYPEVTKSTSTEHVCQMYQVWGSRCVWRLRQGLIICLRKVPRAVQRNRAVARRLLDGPPPLQEGEYGRLIQAKHALACLCFVVLSLAPVV